MKKKQNLIYIGSAAILITSNWSSVKEWDRDLGVTSLGISPAFIGLIFAGVASLILLVSAYRNLRELLDKGIRIPRNEILIEWYPVCYLVPLLFHSNSSVISRLDDGTVLTHTYGYGTELGTTLFLVGSSAFILFQIVMRLEHFKAVNSEQTAALNCGGCASS